MPLYRRAAIEGGCYFFTVVTYRRQSFLCDADVREALRKAIQYTAKKKPFIINAWVLLPDHLHCIWTLPEHDADFGARWSMIKSFVTMQCKKRLHSPQWMSKSKQRKRESTIWQRRFWEHSIKDEIDFRHLHGQVDYPDFEMMSNHIRASCNAILSTLAT